MIVPLERFPYPAVNNAAQDDLADAEESGIADRERRAWYSRYQAA